MWEPPGEAVVARAGRALGGGRARGHDGANDSGKGEGQPGGHGRFLLRASTPWQMARPGAYANKTPPGSMADVQRMPDLASSPGGGRGQTKTHGGGVRKGELAQAWLCRRLFA